MNKLRIIFFLGLITFSACRPVFTLIDNVDENFSSSEISSDEIRAKFLQKERPEAIVGRARIQISAPGEQERAMVEFTATSGETLLRIRNNLGVEGLRIHLTRDSILVYDRLARSAWTSDRRTGEMILGQGAISIHLMEILFPELDSGFRQRVYESADAYLLLHATGKRVMISKEGYQIRKISYPRGQRFWNSIHLEQYREQQGISYPSRVQVLSSDQKSNIFVLIQQISFHSDHIQLSPGIPDHISIERL